MTLPLSNPQKGLLLQKTHRYATLWTLSRKDGTVFRFTDHSSSIVFEELEFTPISGFGTSARQKQSGLRSQNFEAIGVIDDDAITDDDLRSGKFRESIVKEQLVDWMFPWIGAFYTNIYTITEIAWSGVRWEAQIAGLTSWLQTPVGYVYGKPCDADLGDSRCKFVLSGNAKLPGGASIAATVSGVAVTSVTKNRRQFTSLLPPTYPDGWFKYGKLIWTSGSNSGGTGEVAAYTSSGSKIDLRIRTFFDIANGDLFTIQSGCDKLLSSCRDKFNNVANHRGHPTIPGDDKVIRTPNAH